MSKRYSVTMVRERLSDALDEADRGVPVFIERRGVRYRLSLDAATKKPKAPRRKPRIEILDPAVEAGSWSWDWSPSGLAFRARRRR